VSNDYKGVFQLTIVADLWTITDIEGPDLPGEFIKIMPHPHSLDPTPIIVPLTSSKASPSSSLPVSSPVFQPHHDPCPWAPFKTLADFEYTETAIRGLLSKTLVNQQLAGLNSTWAVESRLTIKNYTDMEKVLAKARKHTVQVCAKVHIFSSIPFTNCKLNSLLASSGEPLFLGLWVGKCIISPLNIEIHGNGFSRL